MILVIAHSLSATVRGVCGITTHNGQRERVVMASCSVTNDRDECERSLDPVDDALRHAHVQAECDV